MQERPGRLLQVLGRDKSFLVTIEFFWFGSRQGFPWSQQSLLALCHDIGFLVSRHGSQF